MLIGSGGRRRGRGQRVLYFFRTPPGVRVGRAPIDEEAIRLLEQNNPDIEFDWARILRAPQSQPEHDRREDRRDRRERSRQRQPASASQLPAPGFQLPAAGLQVPAPTGSDLANAPEPVEPGEPGEPEEPVEPEEADTGDTIEPRYQRIGRDGLTRLRARYSEVLARIAEKPLEEAQREELRVKAERLNPDGWVTEDEVSAALEQYETVFEELRAVVGRHQSRRRRRR